MANLERIVRARMQQGIPTPSRPQTNLEQIVARREALLMSQEEDDPQGFLARFGEGLENVFQDPDFTAAQRGGAGFFEAARADVAAGPFSDADRAQTIASLAGIADPIIGGVQAIAQIPGLFTEHELPTDRAAQYLERLRVGLLTQAEETAIRGGVDPRVVADAHLFGELVGFTAPVVASLKGARFLTRTPGSDLTFGRNLLVDSVAGLIFGSVLRPEEEIGDRALNAAKESGMFGLGALVFSGPLFAWRGWKFARAAQLQREADLDGVLNRIANGERVVLDEGQAISVSQLMSEEGFLASSPAAQAILEQNAFDATLVQSIIDTGEAGFSRGVAREIATDFRTATASLDGFREQFPNLKFDIIKRTRQVMRRGKPVNESAFDIHWGLTGLNNQQRSQLAREGRYAGQMVQKGSSFYTYVRRGKEGRIIVSTIDGRTTSLREAGVTNIPTATEAVPLPGTGEALYEDFRTFTFAKMQQAGGATGTLSETDVVRFIREGQIGLTDDAVRNFESPGAITHPSEAGLTPGQGAATVEEFTEAYLRDGAHGNGLLNPEPIRKMDDAFDAWLRERNLTPNAEDLQAFKANFFQRMRSDIWALVPDADLKAMRSIQEETFRLIEAEDLPFEVLAGSKGFHVERKAGGEIVFRDINSGARLNFANEEVARGALQRTIRSEKDALFDFLTPGPHGGQALSTGFDPTDGVFAMGGNIDPTDFQIFPTKDIPFQMITNRRDYLDALERGSGVPIFNEGFAKIDDGLLRMEKRLQPVQARIAGIWKGLKRRERVQVVRFWTDVEGTNLAGPALIRAARDAGLSGKQISAFTQARNMFDLAAQQRGLDRSRYIPTYYARIQPTFVAEGNMSQGRLNRLLRDSPDALKEFQDFAEMNRSGDLSQIEMDPEIVMHKHFRSLFYAQEVSPHEEAVRRMMNTRVRDLTPAQQRVVIDRSLPGTGADTHVFPDVVRGTLQEYINSVRGDFRPGFASARRAGVNIFSKLRIDIDPQVMDELYYTLLSLPYAAAMGLRIALLNRNATQNLWNMYTRVGGKHASNALEIALKQSGFDEAMAAGAIRDFSQAVPEADAVFQAFYNTDIARGRGPLSNAAASMIRRGVRTGRMTRKAASQFLVPYGSGEQVNRSWAYHWQKLHTAEAFARYDAKIIDWDGFLEEGLPFFSDSIKRGFRTQMDTFGRETALQWIGKQAADEGHFIYNSLASPTWMQTYFGKLGGMFGQWSLWQKQLYFNRMATGTPRQIAAFWARTAAVTGAIANVSIQTGVNMNSWYAPLSLGFGGGPVVDMAITAKDIWSGPLDQKAAAVNRLAEQAGSLAIPGQLFYKEVASALDESDPAQAVLRLTLGRAADQGNFNYDFILNPDTGGFDEGVGPTTRGLPSLDSLPGIR